MVEHGPLQWQGGGYEPRSLDPHERVIFDIGIRPCADDSPLILLVYFGANEVRRVLPTPGHYEVTLGIYGRNISTTEKLVPITVGKTAREIEFAEL